jgi:uncharacterized membrane protein
MKNNFRWLSAIIVVMVLVSLIDVAVQWLHNPASRSPVLKYGITSLVVIFLLMMAQIIIGKRNSKNN